MGACEAMITSLGWPCLNYHLSQGLSLLSQSSSVLNSSCHSQVYLYLWVPISLSVTLSTLLPKLQGEIFRDENRDSGVGARPVPPSGARTVGTVSGWVSQRFEDRGWAGLGGGRNLVELPSPTFLKGPARAGAGQRWPHPVCVRPEQGLTLVARRRGWALLVATVPSGLRARRQPLHSPSPPFPSFPLLPPSLPPCSVPSLLQSVPSFSAQPLHSRGSNT